MSLKVSDVLGPMLDAAKKSLGKDWSKVKDYGEPEFKSLAQSMVDITGRIASGKISKRHGKALLRIHANTTQTVFLTIEGLGIIAVENAINAALKAARKVLKAAIGFSL